jgi:hypothetical protein
MKQPVPSAVGVMSDPFGMGDFGSHDSGDPSQQELENAIGLLDKRLLEMKVRQCHFFIHLYVEYAILCLLMVKVELK